MKKTDDLTEMLHIARSICEEKKGIYTPLTMSKLYQSVENHIPNASPEEKEQMVYRAIYDWWAFGANVDEEFYYHFYEKPPISRISDLCRVAAALLQDIVVFLVFVFCY